MKQRKKLNEVSENKRFDYKKRFYSRFVTNLIDIRNDENELTLQGDNPFADGDILIEKNGHWYCDATGETGDYEDFLRKENPLLTDIGAVEALIEEAAATVDWHGVKILDDSSFRKELNSFREFVKKDKSLPPDQRERYLANNFYFNKKSEFIYMELSRTNAPLCRYHWGLRKPSSEFFFHTCGVSRIHEHPDKNRIYFVEDPKQMFILKEIVSDPIYIKPDEHSFLNNDYHRMVKGKEIVFCSSGVLFHYNYEDLDFERIEGNDKKAVTELLTRPRAY